MKGRIVIKDEIFADFLIKNKDNHNISASPKVIMDRCRVEQLPETWEDLKELIIDRAKYIFNDKFFGNSEYFVIAHNYFIQDGRILDAYQNCFAANRTPQQMWNIIKNLVGEE